MSRRFFINGMSFCIADYRPRNNEFERGLKYQLLIEINDGLCVRGGNVSHDSVYRSTGIFGSTIKELRDYAIENSCVWR